MQSSKSLVRNSVGLLVLVLSTIAAAAAETELIFKSYMDDAGTTYFSLTQGDASSDWIPLGRTFEGHKLVSFDRATLKLTVERAGVTRQLTLRDARAIPDSRAEFKARLRSLKGLARAREAAKDGDADLVSTLARYDQLVAEKSTDEQHKFAMQFLKERAVELGDKIAAKILSEGEAGSARK
jgi:hypothetical protein